MGSFPGDSRLCQANNSITYYSSAQTTFSVPAHIRALLEHERMKGIRGIVSSIRLFDDEAMIY